MNVLLRTSILDAAADAAAAEGWPSVRMVDLAEAVGVSRQTIYNEFGTKDDVAKALFMRELHWFEAGIVDAVRGATSLPDATRSALTWLLEAAHKHGLVHRILSDARSSTDGKSLLPVLTVHAEQFGIPIRKVLLDEFSKRWPGEDQRRAELAIDLIIRWTLTQIINPSDFDEAEVIESIVEMTTAALRPPRVESDG